MPLPTMATFYECNAPLPEIFKKPISQVIIPAVKMTEPPPYKQGMSWEQEPTLKEVFDQIKELRKEVSELKTKANSRIKIYQMEDIKKYE